MNVKNKIYMMSDNEGYLPHHPYMSEYEAIGNKEIQYRPTVEKNKESIVSKCYIISMMVDKYNKLIKDIGDNDIDQLHLDDIPDDIIIDKKSIKITVHPIEVCKKDKDYKHTWIRGDNDIIYEQVCQTCKQRRIVYLDRPNYYSNEFDIIIKYQ